MLTRRNTTPARSTLSSGNPGNILSVEGTPHGMAAEWALRFKEWCAARGLSASTASNYNRYACDLKQEAEKAGKQIPVLPHFSGVAAVLAPQGASLGNGDDAYGGGYEPHV